MLPDRSVLIGQKLVENAKIKKFKCDILSNFQTFFFFFATKNRVQITVCMCYYDPKDKKSSDFWQSASSGLFCQQKLDSTDSTAFLES